MDSLLRPFFQVSSVRVRGAGDGFRRASQL